MNEQTLREFIPSARHGLFSNEVLNVPINTVVGELVLEHVTNLENLLACMTDIPVLWDEQAWEDCARQANIHLFG